MDDLKETRELVEVGSGFGAELCGVVLDRVCLLSGTDVGHRSNMTTSRTLRTQSNWNHQMLSD